jgi:hypothetical protein
MTTTTIITAHRELDQTDTGQRKVIKARANDGTQSGVDVSKGCAISQ